MRIYVASSWRNERHPAIVEALRKAGHDVYDFRNPEASFDWKQLGEGHESWTLQEYLDALSHPRAEAGFRADYEAMQWADALVMVLPCGNSAHLEAGWASGSGRPMYVLAEQACTPELMYKLGEGICTSLEGLIVALERGAPPVPPRQAVTWCPQCGPCVACDEDGCCAGCGAQAFGAGADQALAALRRAANAEREATAAKEEAERQRARRNIAQRDRNTYETLARNLEQSKTEALSFLRELVSRVDDYLQRDVPLDPLLTQPAKALLLRPENQPASGARATDIASLQSEAFFRGEDNCPHCGYTRGSHREDGSCMFPPRFKCRECGCTELDCRGCIERTGEPCYWVEADLCSACNAGLSEAEIMGALDEGRRDLEELERQGHPLVTPPRQPAVAFLMRAVGNVLLIASDRMQEGDRGQPPESEASTSRACPPCSTDETVIECGHWRTRCEHCGWAGWSSECSEARNVDGDADVVCPSCGRVFACDEI